MILIYSHNLLKHYIFTGILYQFGFQLTRKQFWEKIVSLPLRSKISKLRNFPFY